MEEKRRFSRLNLAFDAQVKFADNVYTGEVLDLSLKGVLIELENFPVELGSLCEVMIPLSEEIVMNFASTLVHEEGNNFGFKFESIDLDSMTHLRRCLEFNADDPEKITQELFFLVQ